jgi:hypothetical protein
MTPKQTPTQIAAEALVRANEAVSLNEETHRMVKELRDGLMMPQPGYTRSFVDRVTEVVLEAEAGKIVGERLVWYAKVLTALSVVAAAIYSAAHWGNGR